MDAKAKVVRYMFWPHGAKWLDGVLQSYGAEMEINSAGDYVLHSDHELALVELIKEHEAALAELRKLYDANLGRYQFMSGRLLAAEEKLTTLFSGLEALAGEIEAAAGHACATAQENWARKLRTLASAGLEGK